MGRTVGLKPRNYTTKPKLTGVERIEWAEQTGKAAAADCRGGQVGTKACTANRIYLGRGSPGSPRSPKGASALQASD